MQRKWITPGVNATSLVPTRFTKLMGKEIVHDIGGRSREGSGGALDRVRESPTGVAAGGFREKGGEGQDPIRGPYRRGKPLGLRSPFGRGVPARAGWGFP